MNHQVEFHGKTKEYFGIWIVNILLSIATLGIYSAWAKVRTNRYFYGNTFIDGHAFDYHANGKQILIGRIIVVVALALYYFLAQVSPVAALVLIVIYGALFPALIVRGLRFSRRITSYRNVRFDFTGTYKRALWVMVIFPILNILTVYLMTPLVSRKIAQFIANESHYGNKAFHLSMPVGPLYKVIAIGFVTAILLPLILAVSIIELGFFNSDVVADHFKIGVVLLPIFAIIAYFLTLIYNAILRNLTFNHLTLDNHRFNSTIKPATYAMIFLTNALATLFTLGLMAPWAKVRMARYIAVNTTLVAGGLLDEFTSTMKTDTSAIGEEFMDMEGVDIGVGL